MRKRLRSLRKKPFFFGLTGGRGGGAAFAAAAAGGVGGVGGTLSEGIVDEGTVWGGGGGGVDGAVRVSEAGSDVAGSAEGFLLSA